MPKIESKVGRIVVSILTALYLLLGFYVVVKPGWKEYKGDGFSIKYPASWFVEETAKERPEGALSNPYGQEYLLLISDGKTKFGLPLEEEHAKIIVTRYPKDQLGLSIQTLADTRVSRINSTQITRNKIFIDGFLALNDVARNAKSIDNEDSYYWIDAGKYTYDIVCQIYENVTFFTQVYNRFLINQRVLGLKFQTIK